MRAMGVVAHLREKTLVIFCGCNVGPLLFLHPVAGEGGSNVDAKGLAGLSQLVLGADISTEGGPELDGAGLCPLAVHGLEDGRVYDDVVAGVIEGLVFDGQGVQGGPGYALQFVGEAYDDALLHAYVAGEQVFD